MTHELKILLVDDDEVDRILVRRYLKKSTLKVDISEAHTAEQALNALRNEAYDCALLDYRLPDGDGLSILRALHEAQIDTPVIVLTGMEDQNLISDLRNAGAVDCLSKNTLSTDALHHCLQLLMP
jgi:DNA-binding NarL/FixJ family response regulator